MSFFSKLAETIRTLFARKQKDEEWAARFTNPPADRDNKLPLDRDGGPGIS